MNGYLHSAPGRLLTFAVGLALAGAGTGALVGGVAGVALLGFGILFGAACTIFAMAIGIEEHAEATILAAILLPFALFLFAVGQSVFAPGNAALDYALLALGAGAMARALLLGAPTHDATRSTHMAGAH